MEVRRPPGRREARLGVAALLLLCPQAGAPQGAPTLPARIDAEVRASPGYDRANETAPGDDGEFLRRVMLDLAGCPPSADEVGRFLAEESPQKRAAKIDELLSSLRFADLWSRQFAEVFFGDYHEFRIDTDPPLPADVRARIARRFIDWMRDQIHADRPYGEIVFEMLGSLGALEERPALAYKLSFHRGGSSAPGFATGVSRHLLGIRLSCSGCHDHPFDRWTTDDYEGLVSFAAREKVAVRRTGEGGWRIEVTEGDPAAFYTPRACDCGIHPARPCPHRRPVKPVFLFGGRASFDEGLADALARFMTAAGNRQLARALVNRVWGWLLGRGVVDPVDEFDARNRLGSGGLLDLLSREFDQGGRSIKSLIRAICATDAYQRASGSAVEMRKVDFSRAIVRPLTTEKLLNSIRVATEGKSGVDPGEARALADTVGCGRIRGCEVTPVPIELSGLLFLRQGERVWKGIRGGGVLAALRSPPGPLEGQVEAMFLAALSRRPSEPERKRYVDFLKSHAVEGCEDAYWSLLNTTEFLTRH
jgi:hypothetical protein